MTLLATLRRCLLAVALGAFLFLAPSVVAADATTTQAGPPAAVVAPLGTESTPAVVSYGELLKVARQGRLNAAVVDTAAYWVAAVDRNGHTVAARIPAPKAGTDFGRTRSDSQAVIDVAATPSAFDLSAWLHARNVVVIAAGSQPAQAGGASAGRSILLPLGVAVGFAIILAGMMAIRRSGLGGGKRSGPGGHGRMRKNARVEPPMTRFTDVAGCDEAVEELQEVVTFLREPTRFSRVGARMPRGVILYGAPGTGKTLLAKAVAGESGVPFYAVSGSDFVDTFVGVGAARVRDLFLEARKQEKGAIIFFDEIDAIGRKRGSGISGSDSEREATLNQLLVELDGFGARDRIVVMAATNRVDMLDDALTRPGRFDRRVQVGVPAEAGRLAILRLYAQNKPLANTDDLERIATVTAGFAGADLANLLNEAAIMAARAGRDNILAADLDEGMLRAVAGPERKDRRLAEGELETIAWHEAGHCLAAELCPTHVKTQRVTILARGDAGGLALYGNEDRALTSPQRLHERMVVAMAGRAAEEIGFDAISSGAANDIEQVTGMARTAVEKLGFSTRVGQMTLPTGPHGGLSEETRRIIENEVAAMVDAAYRDALAMLREHRDELELLAGALLDKEQLDRDDIVEVLGDLAARRVPSRRPASAERVPVQAELAAAQEPSPGPRRRRRAAIPVPTPSGLAGAVARGASAGAAVAAAGVRVFRRGRVARRPGAGSPG
ncbi:MAG: AAA family ATPase [Thermoleophilia bacterium]|nr:AAA family ATPase [Thermoleophilia bacterium]